MIGERYTIEVSDSEVLIHGYLSIREAFDFLSFFDQQGYDSVMPGDQNSALRLIKKNTDNDSLEDDDEQADQLEEIAYLQDVCREQSEKIKEYEIENQRLHLIYKQMSELTRQLLEDDKFSCGIRDVQKAVFNSITKSNENDLPY